MLLLAVLGLSISVYSFVELSSDRESGANRRGLLLMEELEHELREGSGGPRVAIAREDVLVM